MTRGSYVVLDCDSGVTAALSAGGRAGDRALSSFDAPRMKRLQPLAPKRRDDLDGFDDLDPSVLECAPFYAFRNPFRQRMEKYRRD